MYKFFVILFVSLFFSCSKTEKGGSPVAARVGNEFLRANDNMLKKSLSSETTLKQIDRWVEETVLYNAAIEKNLNKDSLIIKKRDAYFKRLIISSFLEQEAAPAVNIKKSSIRHYYKKNKAEFKRTEDVVYVDHYIADDIQTAKTISSFLLLKKTDKKTDVSRFLHASEYIKKDQVHPVFNDRLFNDGAQVVGPIEKNKKYHILNILEKYKKGSYVGLDLVSDKIYQRLYKKEEIIAKNKLIDSLKNNVNIYINPKYKTP